MMAKKKTTTNKTRESRLISERKNHFLTQFARESPDVREAIVRDISAYNALLDLEAQSFEELALLQLCDEKKLPHHLAETLVPKCPYCGSEEHVGRKEAGIYRCRPCGKTFTLNYNSISTGTKCEAITWMKLLHCLLSYTSMSKATQLCGISDTTYFRMRNKLFYAMRLLLDGLEDRTDEYGVKLCGNIQVDNTFVRLSFKGMQLDSASDINDFPEESIFFDESYRPRPAKKRGRPNKMSERGANSIVIFTAIDDRGRVLTRFAGTGATSLRLLKTYIPEGKFLIEVPEKLPFESIAKQKDKEPVTMPGDRSLMIADKERALESYAKALGLDFEAHVYRENGTQRQMAPGHHDIQRVNALHARLKNHLRCCGYVSTKYLPGILTLFEFMENFDEKKGVEELFKVLSKPHLGKPPQFYQTLFTVPNYLEEWFESNGALRRLPYNKLLAFYLYDHLRHPEDYPEVNGIDMVYIEHITGYVRTTIRRSYRELEKTGYRQKILDYFGEPDKKQKQKKPKKEKKAAVPTPKKKREQVKHYTVNYPPVIYAMYDEYIETMKKRPRHLRPYANFEEFRIAVNAKYGTNFGYNNLQAKFSHIRESGFREELPLSSLKKKYGEVISPKNIMIWNDYEELVRSFREKGEALPPVLEMRTCIGEKYGLTAYTVGRYLDCVRAYKRNHPEEFAELLKQIQED